MVFSLSRHCRESGPISMSFNIVVTQIECPFVGLLALLGLRGCNRKMVSRSNDTRLPRKIRLSRPESTTIIQRNVA